MIATNREGITMEERISHTYGIETLATGTRIELHPSTTLWMRGACFGNIIDQARRGYRVRLDAGIVGFVPYRLLRPVL
jgi:hypothetical protein